MRGSLYSRDDLMAKYGLPEVHGEDEGEDGRPDRAEEFDGGVSASTCCVVVQRLAGGRVGMGVRACCLFLGSRRLLSGCRRANRLAPHRGEQDVHNSNGEQQGLGVGAKCWISITILQMKQKRKGRQSCAAAAPFSILQPMRRVIDQAKQAAQAAKSGFKAAADIAQGAWSRMRSEQKGKQEL
jgi:hypothetical protein